MRSNLKLLTVTGSVMRRAGCVPHVKLVNYLDWIKIAAFRY